MVAVAAHRVVVGRRSGAAIVVAGRARRSRIGIVIAIAIAIETIIVFPIAHGCDGDSAVKDAICLFVLRNEDEG